MGEARRRSDWTDWRPTRRRWSRGMACMEGREEVARGKAGGREGWRLCSRRWKDKDEDENEGTEAGRRRT